MDRPLNIVSVFYARPHLGGSGIMSLEASKELARREHNVHIVSYPGTYLTEEEKGLGLKISPVDNIAYPCFKAEPYHATLPSMIANLHTQGFQPDIIHANYAITHGDSALTAREIIKRRGGDPKVVITNHGSDIHTNGHHGLLAPYLEHVLSSADAITFVSRALQDEARDLFELPNYGEVVYNFVDERRFVPATMDQKLEARDKLGIPREAFVVYHASNFRRTKRTDMLVESARLLGDMEREVYFLMVGDGPEKTQLKDSIRGEADLEKRVRFEGIQDDVLPFIWASDVDVLCSERESFGLSLLEGMSAGLVGLGSEAGGIPEVITNEEDGFLFRIGDVHGMTYWIRKLTTDPELAKGMGLAAREKVLKHFDKTRIVNQYEDLYRRLVA